MGYSGVGGKLIHEKNQEQKISWHCPFKYDETVILLLGIAFMRKNKKKIGKLGFHWQTNGSPTQRRSWT